eukprot:jgi/Botrbrau1/13862/Bobra.0056s0095.1
MFLHIPAIHLREFPTLSNGVVRALATDMRCRREVSRRWQACPCHVCMRAATSIKFHRKMKILTCVSQQKLVMMLVGRFFDCLYCWPVSFLCPLLTYCASTFPATCLPLGLARQDFSLRYPESSGRSIFEPVFATPVGTLRFPPIH